jgi:hemerythrin-like domain-containing protein
MAVPTREQVLEAIGAERDYHSAARRLGIPAGQAYMIATGLPADGGDTFPPSELRRPGIIDASTQGLVYAQAAPENPTTKPHVLEWIKGMAQVDGQMAEAARGRDAVPGEPEEPDVTDIGAVLTRQHDQVTAMLEALKAIPGVSAGGSEVHQSRRKSVVDLITVALSKHEATEEEHFWPVVRSALADGDERAGTALQQEQEGKDLLHSMSDVAASEQEFDEMAEQLDQAARKHVAFEDRVLLALESAMSEEDRSEVGRKFLRAYDHAPTRPHPHAPKEHATAVKAAGAAAAALDRARDAVGDRPAKRRGKASNEQDRDAGGKGK